MAKLFDLVAGAGIAQGIFVAGILLFGRRSAAPGNKILAFLLLALALSTAHPFFGPSLGPAADRGFLIDPTQTLVNPFIWLFVSARTSGRRFRLRSLLHFAPFVAICAFLLLAPPCVPPLAASVVYWAFAFAQALAYFVPSAAAVRTYSKALERTYSKLDAFRLEGLHAFMGVILAILAGRLVGLAIMAHSSAIAHADRIMGLLLAFAVYFLGVFMALRREPETPNEAKYRNSSMTSREAAVEFAAVEARLKADKRYLDPELTLPGLAGLLGMNRNDLSRIINEGGGSSFYDFVNRLRIEEFQSLSRDPAKSSWKILALAYEAGFNSKPAFNSAFKRLTGTTPSTWIEASRKG